MNQEIGTIYITTNLVNGKQYVGQTSNKLNNRISEHKYGTKIGNKWTQEQKDTQSKRLRDYWEKRKK